MDKKTYAVMGATGQVGRFVTEHLIKQGHHVKAIGRNPQKLDFLKKRGAEAVQIESFESKEALTKAFAGVDGVFCILPPGGGVEKFAAYQDSVGEAIVEAIKSNHIRHVVNLSSMGAHLPEGTGPIKGLYRQEQRLNALTDVNIIHLRPAYFMENFLWSIPMVQHAKVLATPLKPDLELLMVATPDIGMKAAEFLQKLDFQGHTVFEFTGPKPATLIEVAKAVGNSIGKPDLKYIQIPYDEIKKSMLASGLKGDMPDLLIEMYQAINEEKCEPTQTLAPEQHGKTTLGEFAAFFAEVYKSQGMQQAGV